MALNILSKLDLLDSLNSVKPILGVIIEGNVPFIVISGLLTTLILKKLSADYRKTILTIAALGDLLHYCRIYTEKMVHNFKDTGNSKLGIYLQRNKHDSVCTALLDHRYQKEDQSGPSS